MPGFAKRRAIEDPDGFALVDPTQELSWAEVDESLNRVANKLLSVDLGPARRVAVFAENAAETALAHLGGLLAGASTVPVNFHLSGPEAAYILEDCEASVLFCDAHTAERALEAAAEVGVETVVAWGVEGVDGVTSWSAWLAEASTEDPPVDLEPRPNLLYTSGTTGRPKATELPPSMFAGGATIAEHLVALADHPFTPFGTHLVVGPMYHTGSLQGMRLLAAGVPSVILGRFDAERTLQAIDRYQTGTSIMVPTHFVRLLGLPADVRERYDVSSLANVRSTGAKMPIETMEQMIDWWGPIFGDSYGATEVGTVCRIASPEWLGHKGSVGQTLPGFTAHVMDEDLNELPPGDEGLLYFRDETGRGIVYPNDAEKTAASNPQPGLFTLGEIGYVDPDGFVFITDRASDMVVSGGVNLYPAEVELIMLDHAAVADIACIGVPHADLGEELRALVVPFDPRNPPDTGELSGWLRERLTLQKCPRSWEIVPDLGRNTMGKLNKRRLRDNYLAGELAPGPNESTEQDAT